MTWGALFIEFALGTLVWIKELRYPVIFGGVLLHLGIEFTMTIGFFEWMMMFSFLLFVDSEHLEVYVADKVKSIASDIKEKLYFDLPVDRM